MLFTNEVQLSNPDKDEDLSEACLPHAESRNATGKLCAYNQTRECFLGLDVRGLDVSAAKPKHYLDALTFKSGEGIWLSPFRGIPDAGLRMPLDLIYLDADGIAIDLVESYPTFRVRPSSPRADSVLALPTHSIYSSQTQIGDQLVLCAAGEMEERLARLASSPSAEALTGALTFASGSVQSAVLLREKPLWSGGPGLLELGERSIDDRAAAEKPHVMDLIQPDAKTFKPPRTWLERWWSPDPRKAPREESPGLAAYYWTGGPAEPRTIRDISSTGLYVVTEERWYPGTLILLTLQITEEGESYRERSICVHSRAVRWGSDGVGLQFVLPKTMSARDGSEAAASVADRKALDRFLQGLRKGKS